MFDNFRVNVKDIFYDTETRQFVLDCSSFFSVGEGMPQVIEVHNEKTGNVARYRYSSRLVINGHDISHWTYLPEFGCANAAKTKSLVIFNT